MFGIIAAFVGPHWLYYPEERPWYREPPTYPNREPTFEEAVEALYHPEKAAVEAFHVRSSPLYPRTEATRWLLAHTTPKADQVLLEYYRENARTLRGGIYQRLVSLRTPASLAAIDTVKTRIQTMPLQDILTTTQSIPDNLVVTRGNRDMAACIRVITGSPTMWLAEREEGDDAWSVTYIDWILDGPMLDNIRYNHKRDWGVEVSDERLTVHIGKGDYVTFDLQGIRKDTDNDGFPDRLEREIMYTHPNNPDTDGDGTADRMDDNPLTPRRTNGHLSESEKVSLAVFLYEMPLRTLTYVEVEEGQPSIEYPGRGGYVIPRSPTQRRKLYRQMQAKHAPVRPRKLISIEGYGRFGVRTFVHKILELNESTARVQVQDVRPLFDRTLTLEKIHQQWYVTDDRQQ